MHVHDPRKSQGLVIMDQEDLDGIRQRAYEAGVLAGRQPLTVSVDADPFNDLLKLGWGVQMAGSMVYMHARSGQWDAAKIYWHELVRISERPNVSGPVPVYSPLFYQAREAIEIMELLTGTLLTAAELDRVRL